MDIALPAAPLGIITLLGFFAPYAIGALNGVLPAVTKPIHRKIVSVTASIILAAVVMAFYYGITRDPIGDWWLFVLLAIVVVNASYALVTGKSAKLTEAAVTKDAGSVDDANVPDISSLSDALVTPGKIVIDPDVADLDPEEVGRQVTAELNRRRLGIG